MTAPALTTSLQNWAAVLASWQGWRRYLAAFLLGSLATLALAPLHWVVVLPFSFAPLIWLWRGCQGPWQVFRLGWSFGFGYFCAGIYWIGFAFLVEAERFALLMPFAVIAMTGGLALFMGLGLVLAERLSKPGWSRLFAFIAAWLFCEWLRSWIFTGFPWNQIGSVWTGNDLTLQAASLGGIWLLSALALLFATAPAMLVPQEPDKQHHKTHWRSLGAAVLTMLLGPAFLLAYGYLRLSDAPSLNQQNIPGIHLRLVQPAIPQAIKWHPDHRRRHVLTQMRLSAAAEGTPPSHIIWAETAVPYDLAGEPTLARDIAAVIPKQGALITGAPRRGAQGRRAAVWNSLLALDPQGQVIASYDKNHLVPFGEYVPLGDWLDWLHLSQGLPGFTAGRDRLPLTLPGLPPASPLICYEVIFSGAVRPTEDPQQAQWLLNITNDAWFGISSGPHQHFASARLRAVEEGLPLVRVANGGISGTFDAYGRVIAKLALGQQGYLDTPLPRPTDDIPLYAATNTFWPLGTITLIFVISYIAGLLNRYKSID